MKNIFLLLIMVAFCNTAKAQCGIDSLFFDLQYTNDTCKKTLIVTYLSYGKNQINTDSNNETHKIVKCIKYLPHSSISFLYKDKKYYISLSNDCDVSKIYKGDTIMIDITFFKNIKQPYEYKNPFSIVSSVAKF